MRRSLFGCLFVFVSSSVLAAEVLFPAPLHITREITNPITGSRVVIDDYYHGNRVVSVNGRRTAIAEYDKNVLTTIDFETGTYSVAKFDDLAKAWDNAPRQRRAATTEMARVENQITRVNADTQVRLSRAAAEVVLGIAYPNRPDPAADALLVALRSKQPRVAATAEATADYHLPLEQVMRYDAGGETIEVRNVVIRVGNELPPAESLAVPAGAKLIESDAVAARRMLDELDGKRSQ